LFSRLFQYLNSRSEETLYAPGSGYPLGGWLILLGVSLAAILMLELIRLFQWDYFSFSTWAKYGSAGGTALQYLYLSQLALQLTVICGAGALLYWFFKKRDIFPRMFLWYAGILLSGRLLLLLLFYVTPIPASLGAYRAALTLAFLRSGVYALIWVAYVLRSGQVKSTFLEPFRERIR
jgi:phosphate starvation-inducible membrane PsiE